MLAPDRLVLLLAADPEPLCADCVAHQGLCRVHAYDVLPELLSTNWPVWLMGATAYQTPEPESPAAKRVRERKARKRAKRSRLARALAGEYTRVTPKTPRAA